MRRKHVAIDGIILASIKSLQRITVVKIKASPYLSVPQAKARTYLYKIILDPYLSIELFYIHGKSASKTG